jgi:hypothetical protein
MGAGRDADHGPHWAGTRGDDLGVRWVAIRHAADHVHIVATLARQDGTRPRIWNDFYRAREACQDAETRLGLRRTGPADRTAARRPSRAEAEQSARRGWGEPPRDGLRREVCTAAGGARSEQEFFTRLGQAGVAVRKRYSITSPGEVTGYAVGLPAHTAKDGGMVWYGGGKLAADLTLPKLRHRWAARSQQPGPLSGRGLPSSAARAVLRNIVTEAAQQARDEAGFFARLRDAGVAVRLRFSQASPGQVTGYAVAQTGHDGPDGVPVWYGGGRLAAGLTLPRLRRGWDAPRNAPERSGAFRFTAAEQNAIFGTRPVRPLPRPNTSATPLATTRPRPRTRPGRRLMFCMPRRRRWIARTCSGPLTATTAPPVPATGTYRLPPARGTSCAPPRG